MPTRGDVCAVVLAAGKGTRMKSSLPKVLHGIAGRPMLTWVMTALQDAGVRDMTFVLSPDLDPFQSFLKEHPAVRVTVQHTQRGTGDALASAAPAFSHVQAPSYAKGELLRGQPIAPTWILVTAGDTPAISPATLNSFIGAVKDSGKSLGVLGMNVPNPHGYGRIVRDKKGSATKIVEERDADTNTKAIKLCNSGVIMGKSTRIFELLANVSPNNSQHEYYITDIFRLAADVGEPAHVFETDAYAEFAGVNDRVQLESLERWLLQRRAHDLMTAGVTMHRPETIYVEADAVIEQDVILYPGVCVLNGSRISRNVILGPGAVADGAFIGAGAKIGANAVITRCSVMAGSTVPPGTIRTEMDY